MEKIYIIFLNIYLKQQTNLFTYIIDPSMLILSILLNYLQYIPKVEIIKTYQEIVLYLILP